MTNRDKLATNIIIFLVAINGVIAFVKAIYHSRKSKRLQHEEDIQDD